MSRRRPVSKRARNVIGIIIAVGVVGYGAIMLGLGLSGFANVHALASRGVPDVGETGSAWAETVVGAIFLALVPLSFLISLVSAGRRRRRAVQAALGG